MLTCADLFAGAGGFSLAARQAGLSVRLAVEHDKHAVETYRDNLCEPGGTEVLGDDITELDPAMVFGSIFKDLERCDLLLGGPPCQGFSAHRINDAGVGDERNDLIHVYFDFVRAFAPTAFLMENVPGMLWPRHRAALDRFYAEGRAAGYDLFDPVLIDARNYGLGQRRKRVFILGIRTGTDVTDFTWPPAPTHGSEAMRRCRPELLPWSDCSAAFAPAAEGDPNDIHMSHGDELIAAFMRTPANGGSRKDSGRQLPCHRKHDGHKDVYGRMDPRRPAPTMTTACINPSKGRFVHPVEHHGITVRQAARIQTFPDSFIFSGGLMAAGKQVGNAVPVELGRLLIGSLVPVLTRARDDGAERGNRPNSKLRIAA